MLSIAAHAALGAVLALVAPPSPAPAPRETEIVFHVRTRPIVHEDPLPAVLRETRPESLAELRERVPAPSEQRVERTASNLDELLAAESPQSARAERSLDSSEFARARELSPSTMARHLLPRVASAAPGDAPPPSLAIASAPVAPDAPDASASARSVHTPARPASELNAPVRFPSSALRLGLQGTALLAVDVDREGHVTAIELLRSSGHDSLDRAALEGVRGWRFVPAKNGDERVASRVEVPVTFRIDAQ